jgi:hypothetical protein
MDAFYTTVVGLEQSFLRKYVLSSFEIADWNLPSLQLRDAFVMWRLCLRKFRYTLAGRHEFAPALLASVLSDSPPLMRVFYGSIQSSENRSLSFRLEVLNTVKSVTERYAGQIPYDTAHHAHYLVLLVAVSDGTDHKTAESVSEESTRRF